MPITTGTNMALILSANCCTGGFSPCACFTRLIIPDKNSIVAYSSYLCFYRSIFNNTSTNQFIFCYFMNRDTFTGDDGFIYMQLRPISILQSAGTCSPLFINIRSPTLKLSIFNRENLFLVLIIKSDHIGHYFLRFGQFV